MCKEKIDLLCNLAYRFEIENSDTDDFIEGLLTKIRMSNGFDEDLFEKIGLLIYDIGYELKDSDVVPKEIIEILIDLSTPLIIP